MKKNGIQCYLANTGSIGPAETKVTLRQSLAAYNDLVRTQLRFSQDRDLMGYRYPIKCDRANLDEMTAQRFFTDPERTRRQVEDFFRGRRSFLEEFEGRYGRIPAPIRESLPYEE